MPVTAQGHGAGHSSSAWLSVWDHSPAEAPELDSATLSIPQHSGTSPSSRIWQHHEQTGQVPKPCATRSPGRLPTMPQNRTPPVAGQEELWTSRVHGPLHTFVRISSAPSVTRGTVPSTPLAKACIYSVDAPICRGKPAEETLGTRIWFHGFLVTLLKAAQLAAGLWSCTVCLGCGVGTQVTA